VGDLGRKNLQSEEVNLISQVATSDATRLRQLRNKFSHAKESLHFDSSKIVDLVKGLSTYEGAETNQGAILAAMSKVTDELTAVVRPA
jgi:DNA-binding MltR family transcriptional regulator